LGWYEAFPPKEAHSEFVIGRDVNSGCTRDDQKSRILRAIVKAARHSMLPSSSSKKAATTSSEKPKNSMLFVRITFKRRVERQDISQSITY
jgi:hypothetical protein